MIWIAKQNYCWSKWIWFVNFSLQQFSAKRTKKATVLRDVKSNQKLHWKEETAAALIDDGTKTKRPTLGRIIDTLNKRCKLSDFTNYISNASKLQERVLSNTYSKSKRQFEISEENVIRSIPTYDIVIGKRKDKAVPLFYRQKPTKENVKGEPPCVFCITVQFQNFLHTANQERKI